MPYIEKERRRELLKGHGAVTPGELNFLITHLVDDYLLENCSARQPDYAAINEVIGVLECAKLEFYRRIAAPYEDEKCAQNGDAYWIANFVVGNEFRGTGQ